MRPVALDQRYLRDLLRRLILTPSPTGLTDAITQLVTVELEHLGVPYELTRRGAIRATLEAPATARIARSSATSTRSGP